MIVLLAGLVLFLGIHSVRIVAPDLRARQIAAGGEQRWKGIYSVVALVGLALIVWGYSLAWPTAPVLYEPPRWLKHLSALLMLFAFVAFGAYLLPAGRIKAALRHPMLVAVKIWALVHLLANGDLAAIVTFGAFLGWAVACRISLKRRGDPGAEAGPVKWDLAALAVGVAIYLLFVWRLHLWLFGAAPIA